MLTLKREEIDTAIEENKLFEVLFNKHLDLWEKETQNIMINFTDEQITFVMYGIMFAQASVGGFLQLLYHGFGIYIFGSPLAASIRKWGATATADLIQDIAPRCLEVANEINGKYTPEMIPELIEKYDDFGFYNKRFMENTGLKEVMTYVENNIEKFITIIE